MASRIRINFHSDSEAMINKQINMELYASYVYMSMVRMEQEIYFYSVPTCGSRCQVTPYVVKVVVLLLLGVTVS